MDLFLMVRTTTHIGVAYTWVSWALSTAICHWQIRLQLASDGIQPSYFHLRPLGGVRTLQMLPREVPYYHPPRLC